MALVRFGALVEAVSGRLGSLCFGRQGGRGIVRVQPVVKPKGSGAVLRTQSAVSYIRHLWVGMTDAQRLPWYVAARYWKSDDRLGVVKTASAYAWFFSCNLRAFLATGSYTLYVGTKATSEMGGELGVEIWPGGPFEVYQVEPGGPVPTHVTVRVQRFVSSSSSKPGRLWRVMARGLFDDYSCDVWPAATAGSARVSPGMVASFGTPGRGEWFLVELVQWAWGWGPTFTSRHLVQIPSCGGELVTNGTFTTGGAPPTGWSEQAPGVLTQVSSDAYCDTYSGKWAVAAGAGFAQFLTAPAAYFPVTAGAAYTFRAVYRVVSGNITRWGLGKDGVGYTWFSGACPTADGEWHRWEVPFTSTYGGTGFRLVCQSNMAGAIDVRWDNVSLRKDTA